MRKMAIERKKKDNEEKNRTVCIYNGVEQEQKQRNVVRKWKDLPRKPFSK